MALMRLPAAWRPRWMMLAIVSTIVLLSAASLLAWRAQRPASAPQPRFVEIAEGVYVLPRPDALPEFRLVNYDGAPFHNGSFSGRWSFVIFGYTFCPDFCPTTLAEFAHTHRLL